MKNQLIVILLLLLGSLAVNAQTPPATTPNPVPDKSWVLKDYPQATDIRWHEEKQKGLYEFEFLNAGKEIKLYFDKTGLQIRKRKENTERTHRQDPSPRRDRDQDGDDRQN